MMAFFIENNSNIDLLSFIVGLILVAVGLLFAMLNKWFGHLDQKYFKSGKSSVDNFPWFPRSNAILLGILLVLGGILNLYKAIFR